MDGILTNRVFGKHNGHIRDTASRFCCVIYSRPLSTLNIPYECDSVATVIVQLYTTTLVANLALLNVRAAPDLIFASPAELIGKLPAGSVTFTELTNHITHVTAAFMGPAAPVSGANLVCANSFLT